MMILAAIVFTGIALLVWYLITGFVDLGALKAFLIFLTVGPLYLLATWLSGTADQNTGYGSDWTLPVGRILAVIGIAIFSIISISPFFASWRAVTGFWPHVLLFFIGSWIIYLLIHALMFLIRLFTT